MSSGYRYDSIFLRFIYHPFPHLLSFKKNKKSENKSETTLKLKMAFSQLFFSSWFPVYTFSCEFFTWGGWHAFWKIQKKMKKSKLNVIIDNLSCEIKNSGNYPFIVEISVSFLWCFFSSILNIADFRQFLEINATDTTLA